MAGPLNYTTTVPAAKTVGEITHLLGTAEGVTAVGTRYAEGAATGISFTLTGPHGPRSFTLPVNVPGVARMLATSKAVDRNAYRTPQHAERVAWRIAKDWLEAQLALVDAHMADLAQVMLPYLHVDEERTLYDAYVERETLALPAGAS